MALPVPTNEEELKEILSDDKRRTEIFADGESTAEFIRNYTKAVNKGDVLGKQIAEQVQTGLQDFLKDNGVTDRPDNADAMAELVARLPKPSDGGNQSGAAYNPLAPGVAADKLGLVNLGDTVNTIWGKNPAPDMDKLNGLQSVRNAYSSNDPASAGFLIPEEQRAQILQLALEQSAVRPRATVITMNSATQSIPFVDSTSNASSVFGGMIFYWTEESADVQVTEAKFGRVKLEANKLTGGARIPNELFADASALNSWLQKAIPAGLAFYEDDAFLNGSGAGQPLGVLNSPAQITVTKETGQAADTVVFDNIVNMYSRMLPQSLGNAVWLVNQTVFPQLLGLTIDVGTGGAPVGLVNISDSPFHTMLGRPIIVTEKVPTLGDANDVNFVDFSYYLLGDRQAISMDASEHSRFMNDETELRVIERVDGRPWVQSAFTPKNGSTISPIVSLGERA